MNRVVIVTGKEGCRRQDVIDAKRCAKSVETALSDLGYTVRNIFVEKGDFLSKEKVFNKIARCRADCVFNLFEGFSDDSFKEAEFAKMLESSGVPFTGNASAALKVCRDKAALKEVLSRKGITTPAGKLVKRITEVNVGAVNIPLFIKPCCEDASLGIDRDALVVKKEQLCAVVRDKLRQFPQGVLIEEFIPGKEYNIGMMGDYPYEALNISVIDYTAYKEFPPFLTYRSKWDYNSEEFKRIFPQSGVFIAPRLRKEILRLAKKIGKILSCRSYFRVDFREKKGKLFVLDVNPNPDINEDSGFIKQAGAAGLGYNEVVGKIVALAVKR